LKLIFSNKKKLLPSQRKIFQESTIMAIVTLEYDGRNKNIRHIIESMVNMGIFSIKDTGTAVDDTKMTKEEFTAKIEKARRDQPKPLTKEYRNKLFSI